MAEVSWDRQALDDLDSVILSTDQFDPDAALLLGDRLFALGQGLCDFPRRGRLRSDGTHEMTNVPPYILRCRVEDEQVTILDIRHGRQRPR